MQKAKSIEDMFEKETLISERNTMLMIPGLLDVLIEGLEFEVQELTGEDDG